MFVDFSRKFRVKTPPPKTLKWSVFRVIIQRLVLFQEFHRPVYSFLNEKTVIFLSKLPHFVSTSGEQVEITLFET